MYVTAVPLDVESNGGSRCCRTHVRRMAADPGIDLRVAAVIEPHQVEGTRAFLAAAGVEGGVFVRNMQTAYPAAPTLRASLAFGWRMATRHHWELEAMHQQAVQGSLEAAAAAWQAEAVVFDYLFSALFAPGLLGGALPSVIVTLNREAAFYGEMIGLGMIPQHPALARVGWRRLRALERRLHRAADLVVAIGAPDAPAGRCMRSTVITPWLDPAPVPWAYDAAHAREVFFVGAAAHYPNRMAIDWIATRLAPAVAALDPGVRFRIIGAPPVADGPWRQPNVDFLGWADAAAVDAGFSRSGLSICPIANDFGMKFKLAEALSYGTPTVASAQAALSVPYATSLPRLDLDRPDAAARLVVDLAGRRDRLEALSAALRREQAAFAASQATAWSDAIRGAVATHARRTAGRARWRWPLRRRRAGGRAR
jgi:hypothetical protein